MDACNVGNAAVVQALCERGANVNLTDVPGGVRANYYCQSCIDRGACFHGTHLDTKEDVSGMQAFEDLCPGAPLLQSLLNRRHRRQGEPARDLGQLAEVRPPIAKPDGAACAQILERFGLKQARVSRAEWYLAESSGEEVPAEYQVGFH